MQYLQYTAILMVKIACNIIVSFCLTTSMDDFGEVVKTPKYCCKWLYSSFQIIPEAFEQIVQYIYTGNSFHDLL